MTHQIADEGSASECTFINRQSYIDVRNKKPYEKGERELTLRSAERSQNRAVYTMRIFGASTNKRSNSLQRNAKQITLSRYVNDETLACRFRTGGRGARSSFFFLVKM